MVFQEAITNSIFHEISNYCYGNNIESFVVGGFVRDFFLKRPSKDIDILVIGDGITVAKQIAKQIDPKISVTIFKNFGTAYFKLNDYEIEFVGARIESYSGDSRNPVIKPGSLKDDINRRDFKMNSLAVSLNAYNYGELIDYHDGLNDINDYSIPQLESFTKEYKIKPYDYQIGAMAHALRTERALILSPTASGKSLIIYMSVSYTHLTLPTSDLV